MKYLILVSLCVFMAVPLFGQGSFTDFHIGFLFPADAKTGLIGGIYTGRMVDEAVGFGIELDFYRKTYTEDTEFPAGTSGQVEETRIIPDVENATTMLPLLFKLNFAVPVAEKLAVRVNGGVGYEIMWNSVKQYSEHIDDTKFYHGFAWMIGAGLSIPLSRASDIFIEADYHGSSPSRGEGETEEGAPIRTEVDMSGMLLRVGLRLFTIGF